MSTNLVIIMDSKRLSRIGKTVLEVDLKIQASLKVQILVVIVKLVGLEEVHELILNSSIESSTLLLLTQPITRISFRMGIPKESLDRTGVQ